MHLVIELFAPLRQVGARLGPYVLLELLLPGGTLFAVLLFLHRRVKAGGGGYAILGGGAARGGQYGVRGRLGCEDLGRVDRAGVEVGSETPCGR
jgi:hypothetical protein